jgi:phosphoglycolate phosphatase
VPKNNSNDAPRVLLWDIDGTLIRTKRPNSSSPHINVLHSLGCEANNFHSDLSGLTDYEVLVEIANETKREFDVRLLERAFHGLDIESRKLDVDSVFNLCPGVTQILHSLTAAGWSHGILTGNTKSRMIGKLKSGGIASFFSEDLLFYCEYGDSRRDITRRAKWVLTEKHYSKIFILGDTPKDISAAYASDIPVVSIATGKFSVAELSKHKPGLLLRDLSVDAEILFNYLQGSALV